MKENIDYFITEFGTYKIGETALLGNIVGHTHGFITGLNNQHLGLFGSLENAIQAEMEIIEGILRKGGTLYANRMDSNVSSYNYPPNLSLTTYGNQESQADARYKVIDQIDGITTFQFLYQDKATIYTTDLVGEHNLCNLTGVLACCTDLEISEEKLVSEVVSLQAHQKTFHLYRKGDTLLIEDTYNINQNGVIAGVTSALMYNKPLYVIMDDIIELGESSVSTHYELGKKLANMGISHIFLTGKDFSSEVRKGLTEQGFDKITLLSDTDRASFSGKITSHLGGSTLLFLGRMTKPFFDTLMG